MSQRSRWAKLHSRRARGGACSSWRARTRTRPALLALARGPLEAGRAGSSRSLPIPRRMINDVEPAACPPGPSAFLASKAAIASSTVWAAWQHLHMLDAPGCAWLAAPRGAGSRKLHPPSQQLTDASPATCHPRAPTLTPTMGTGYYAWGNGTWGSVLRGP